MTFDSLYSSDERKAYRASLANISSEDLQNQVKQFTADKTNETLGDHGQMLAAQKIAVITEELQMRRLRDKFLGTGNVEGLTDKESDAFRISISSKSVPQLTTLFNELSTAEKTAASETELKKITEKKTMLQGAIHLRGIGGAQG